VKTIWLIYFKAFVERLNKVNILAGGSKNYWWFTTSWGYYSIFEWTEVSLIFIRLHLKAAILRSVGYLQNC